MTTKQTSLEILWDKIHGTQREKTFVEKSSGFLRQLTTKAARIASQSVARLTMLFQAFSKLDNF